MTTRHTYEELAERCVPPEPAQPSSRIADYDTPFLPFPPIPYRDLSTSHHCNLNRLPQNILRHRALCGSDNTF